MTEKRFKVNADYLNNIDSIIDNETGIEHDYLEIEELLNELAEENTHIKNTIKEAYNNERTHMGKSVLKQLIEAIQ